MILSNNLRPLIVHCDGQTYLIHYKWRGQVCIQDLCKGVPNQVLPILRSKNLGLKIWSRGGGGGQAPRAP